MIQFRTLKEIYENVYIVLFNKKPRSLLKQGYLKSNCIGCGKPIYTHEFCSENCKDAIEIEMWGYIK